MIAIQIRNQAAQPIRFAEHESCGAIGGQPADVPPQLDGALQPASPETVIQSLRFIPGIKPDLQFAASVNHAASNELALVREYIDDVAIGAVAIDELNRTFKDPGMATVKRLSTPGLQHDSRGCGTGRCGRLR